MSPDEALYSQENKVIHELEKSCCLGTGMLGSLRAEKSAKKWILSEIR